MAPNKTHRAPSPATYKAPRQQDVNRWCREASQDVKHIIATLLEKTRLMFSAGAVVHGVATYKDYVPIGAALITAILLTFVLVKGLSRAMARRHKRIAKLRLTTTNGEAGNAIPVHTPKNPRKGNGTTSPKKQRSGDLSMLQIPPAAAIFVSSAIATGLVFVLKAPKSCNNSACSSGNTKAAQKKAN